MASLRAFSDFAGRLEGGKVHPRLATVVSIPVSLSLFFRLKIFRASEETPDLAS